MPRYNQKNKQRQIKKRIIILCEGETEAAYFEGFRNSEKTSLNDYKFEIQVPVSQSPTGLVKEAINIINDSYKENPVYQAFIVFDKDQVQDLQQAFDTVEKFNTKITKLEKTLNPPITILYSAVCFEYWLLLHYQDSCRSFNCCEEVIKELKKYYPKYEKSKEVRKKLYEHFKLKLQTAIDHAKLCRKNNPDIDNKDAWQLAYYTNLDLLFSQFGILH